MNVNKQKLICVTWMLVCTSCATIRGPKQRIKIKSDPPGAKVFYHGREIGVTPGFVEIPRGKKESISLLFPDGVRLNQNLNSSYRWGDSFFSNFIWFYGAPLGWGLDLFSGASWEYEKLSEITSQTSKNSSKPWSQRGTIKNDKRAIAVAPPQDLFEVQSEELGNKLTTLIKKRYHSPQILDFEKTLPIFNSFGYHNSGIVKDNYRDKLYYDLNCTHVLESTTEKDNNGILVHSTLTDIYTDEEVDRFSGYIPYSDLKYTGQNSFTERLSSLISIVPNTIAFNVTFSTLNFTATPNSPVLNYRPDSDKTESVLTYLSSIGFRNSRSPRLDDLHGVFRFTPELNFYVDRFHFDRNSGINRLQGLGYNWVSVAIGFGPEVGLETPIGYLYLQAIPSFTTDWISSEVNGSSLASLQLHGEVGYSIFLSQRINFRIFGRAITGPSDLWSTLLSNASGESIQIQSAYHGIYGISVGYYFPEAKSIVKKALF